MSQARECGPCGGGHGEDAEVQTPGTPTGRVIPGPSRGASNLLQWAGPRPVLAQLLVDRLHVVLLHGCGDDEGVLLANTFQTHSFLWTQVEKLRAEGNLVFTVRIPPYVDELTASGVGSIGTVPAAVEQRYLETVHQQLSEYRSGTRPLDEVGRPSRYARDDAARWSFWRLDLTVFAVTAAAEPALAGLLHSL